MIKWTEQKPDSLRCSAYQLYASMPLLAATSVALSPRSPLGLVLIDASLRRTVFEHLSLQTVELGGLLIGRVFDDLWDNSKWVVYVSGAYLRWVMMRLAYHFVWIRPFGHMHVRLVLITTR